VNSSDALLTIAEIAIAVIGFAGIIFALRPDFAGSAESMHRLRLRIMVETSAYVMALAFAPLIFLSGGGSTYPVWRIGTGALAVTAPILFASIYIRQRKIFGAALVRDTILFDSSTIGLGLAIEGVLILTTLGLIGFPAASAYLLGLLFPLGASVAMFIRALFSSSMIPSQRDPPG
jgi:hypothetical protein